MEIRVGDKKKKRNVREDGQMKQKQPRIRYLQGRREKKWIRPKRKREKKSLNPSPVTTPAVSLIYRMRDGDEDVNGGAAAPTHTAGVSALFNV